ncbi:Uncharacterised protein [Helicobacter canis]|uniref:Uncharacterized protein n=2 Tax=Helicobacter canis TaxID=29419 RepID=A0A377J3F7_9HELI|nr:Uncharacterised protein [Helicobacter canis]
MDCHAIATALARNDDKKVDSRFSTHNAPIFSDSQAEAKLDSRNEAQNLKTPAQDSRILEIESGFFKPRKEIRLGCLSTQRGDEIRDSSPKAESTKQQLMPKLARAS